jgi:hypothetical protein
MEALRHAVSDRLLKDEGWTTDSEGRLITETGRALYKPGYVSAIRKILGVDNRAKQIGTLGEPE